MSIVVRPARGGDFGFIVDSWRNSFAGVSEVCKFDRDLFYRVMGRDITGLLRSPTTTAAIACDSEDDDSLAGFVVLTGSVLHYVYVRGGQGITNLRKMGIARQLLEGRSVEAYSYKTDVGVRRIKPEQRGWEYRPREVSWLAGKIRVEIAA